MIEELKDVIIGDFAHKPGKESVIRKLNEVIRKVNELEKVQEQLEYYKKKYQEAITR